MRDDEIVGRGANASWRHQRHQTLGPAHPAQSRDTPAVGPRTELARYCVAGEERILYGQRIDGVVRLTDRPAAANGRAYLVERGLETKAELEALITDYLNVAADLGQVPAGHVPVERYLDTRRELDPRDADPATPLRPREGRRSQDTTDQTERDGGHRCASLHQKRILA